MQELIAALKAQTEAINKLIESNQRLLMILIESEDMPEARTTYLDGTAA